MMWPALVATAGAVLLLCVRVALCLPRGLQKDKDKDEDRGRGRGRGRGKEGQTRERRRGTVRTLVVWGSGGHTTEMLRLTERLRRDVYTPLYYVYAGSDKTSAARIEAAGHPLRPQEEFRIQRSREVKQSWVTTWGTASVACLHAVVLVFRLRPDLVLANGPGTCLPICYAVFLMRVLGWHRSAKVIFCESFCRVQTLSLTGKLVYPIADRFVVHWPELLKGRSRAEYIGQLC